VLHEVTIWRNVFHFDVIRCFIYFVYLRNFSQNLILYLYLLSCLGDAWEGPKSWVETLRLNLWLYTSGLLTSPPLTPLSHKSRDPRSPAPPGTKWPSQELIIMKNMVISRAKFERSERLHYVSLRVCSDCELFPSKRRT